MTPNISVDIDRGEITIGPMHMRRLFNTRGGHTAIEVRVGDERVLCGTVHMRTDEWAEVWGTAIMAAGISDDTHDTEPASAPPGPANPPRCRECGGPWSTGGVIRWHAPGCLRARYAGSASNPERGR